MTVAGTIFKITQAAGTAAYTITASAAANGSIAPSGQVSVTSGTSKSFIITPATGYMISSVTVDGTSVGKVSSYTLSNVTANHTISATFVATNYTLTVSKTGTGSGTVTNSPSGTSFPAGTVVTLTAAPDANSTFVSWSGECSGTGTSSSVTMNSNVNVTATFNTKPSYTITASAAANGSISPSGSVSVSAGASRSFAITPASGYKVAAVTVDGSSVGVVTSYTFSNVSANHRINASFTGTTTTHALTVTRTGDGKGTVTQNPSGSSFPVGTVIVLTATPSWSSVFSGWSGACSGASGTCWLTITSNESVTANFTRHLWGKH